MSVGRAEVLNNYGGNFGTAGYTMNYLGICIVMLVRMSFHLPKL
jgi:hypothetical protein